MTNPAPTMAAVTTAALPMIFATLLRRAELAVARISRAAAAAAAVAPALRPALPADTATRLARETVFVAFFFTCLFIPSPGKKHTRCSCLGLRPPHRWVVPAFLANYRRRNAAGTA